MGLDSTPYFTSPTRDFKNPRLIIGQTGLEIDIYTQGGSIAWSGRFNPNGNVRPPVSLEEIRKNALSYLIAIYKFMLFWSDKSNFGSGAADTKPIRLNEVYGYTHDREHSFRRVIFQSLEKVTGLEIYRGEEDANEVQWHLNIPNLIQSYNIIIQKFVEDELDLQALLKIKFFDRLNLAHHELLDEDFKPQLIKTELSAG